MSGGVGPTGCDISLPKEEQEIEHKEEQDKSLNKSTSTPQRKTSFLSFRQLNCLAVVVVLSASGMVSPEDFGFVLFSVIYMCFISKVAFPSHPSKEQPPIFTQQIKILKIYVFIGAIIGLYAPIAYILHGIFEGDKEGIKAATPHVFLLASQVFMEGVAFSNGFSSPIRAFVPVIYNSRRIFTIVDWLRDEISKVGEEHSGSYKRIYAGRALAVANMAFWCFNLFGFLIPVYLPRVFKAYYSSQKVN
ncbi:hypothetical protein MtrunA17_Chr1g0202951 [Medicago truncatula]|uniref:Plant/K24M7-17 protein n=1 Tax=Medicago truncatula TaxID=3880 RepID=G7IES2_MEDTR|nr:uncharacterized protein LOC11425108 [Medicago truncatula]AES62505.1 plant/K24M7-17 protein [Medicago truncatula]RHN81791.1 hypothetical protein MtrunA17_Chr1g0202951 [Medicago truncatula]